MNSPTAHPAIPHLQQALALAKAGNSAKAMHHIGHAMIHLRSRTGHASGVVKLPSDNPAPVKDMAIGGRPQMDNDADDPTMPPVKPAVASIGSPASLRARLSGLGR